MAKEGYRVGAMLAVVDLFWSDDLSSEDRKVPENVNEYPETFIMDIGVGGEKTPQILGSDKQMHTIPEWKTVGYRRAFLDRHPSFNRRCKRTNGPESQIYKNPLGGGG